MICFFLVTVKHGNLFSHFCIIAIRWYVCSRHIVRNDYSAVADKTGITIANFERLINFPCSFMAGPKLFSCLTIEAMECFSTISTFDTMSFNKCSYNFCLVTSKSSSKIWRISLILVWNSSFWAVHSITFHFIAAMILDLSCHLILGDTIGILLSVSVWPRVLIPWWARNRIEEKTFKRL